MPRKKSFKQLLRELETYEKALEVAERVEKLSNSPLVKQNPGVVLAIIKAVTPLLLDLGINIATKKVKSVVLKEVRK